MSADIVQVLDGVLATVDDDVYRDRLADRGMAWADTAAQYDSDMARLRELRDAITQYRQAWAARLNSESSTAYMERMHAAGDALLALCREVPA